jgi:FkbM family methyltransferase
MFWTLVWAGRPFGGLRPRRFTNLVAVRAYGDCRPEPSDFRWYRDKYGLEFSLHPHYLIDSQIITFGFTEESINNYIDRSIKPGMVCLDVGANIGIMSAHLAKKVRPDGVVHCFEPVPHIHRRLRQNIERNNLQGVARLHHVALSDKAGDITMRIADENLPNQGMGSLVSDQLEELVNAITIKSTTLDDFAENEKLDRLDFIKIDIQGAEPLFLEGGRKTIARFKPILLMEISPVDLAGIGLNSIDLLEKVESLGYDNIYELTATGRTGRKISSKQVRPNYYSVSVLCSMSQPC